MGWEWETGPFPRSPSPGENPGHSLASFIHSSPTALFKLSSSFLPPGPGWGFLQRGRFKAPIEDFYSSALHKLPFWEVKSLEETWKSQSKLPAPWLPPPHQTPLRGSLEAALDFCLYHSWSHLPAVSPWDFLTTLCGSQTHLIRRIQGTPTIPGPQSNISKDRAHWTWPSHRDGTFPRIKNPPEIDSLIRQKTFME